MNEYVRRAEGTPLSAEDRAQLRALAERSGGEIDFSDIPERVYPAALPLQRHTVTLSVDSDVAAFLEEAGEHGAARINFALKRLAVRRGQASPVTATELDRAS